MRRFLTLSVAALWLLHLSLAASFAGNQNMVEKRVQELDSERKRTQQFIPGNPRDGTITFKTYIRNDKNEWIEYKVVDKNDQQQSSSGKVVLEGGKLP